MALKWPRFPGCSDLARVPARNSRTHHPRCTRQRLALRTSACTSVCSVPPQLVRQTRPDQGGMTELEVDRVFLILLGLSDERTEVFLELHLVIWLQHPQPRAYTGSCLTGTNPCLTGPRWTRVAGWRARVRGWETSSVTQANNGLPCWTSSSRSTPRHSDRRETPRHKSSSCPRHEIGLFERASILAFGVGQFEHPKILHSGQHLRTLVMRLSLRGLHFSNHANRGVSWSCLFLSSGTVN